MIMYTENFNDLCVAPEIPLNFSGQRCNDFNVEFVNVCLFILLNVLGTI